MPEGSTHFTSLNRLRLGCYFLALDLVARFALRLVAGFFFAALRFVAVFVAFFFVALLAFFLIAALPMWMVLNKFSTQNQIKLLGILLISVSNILIKQNIFESKVKCNELKMLFVKVTKNTIN